MYAIGPARVKESLYLFLYQKVYLVFSNKWGFFHGSLWPTRCSKRIAPFYRLLQAEFENCGNEDSSVPVAHVVHIKDSCNNVHPLAKHVQCDKYPQHVCGYLIIIALFRSFATGLYGIVMSYVTGAGKSLRKVNCNDIDNHWLHTKNVTNQPVVYPLLVAAAYKTCVIIKIAVRFSTWNRNFRGLTRSNLK